MTWSYSEAPGYRGHPKNNSAMTHPRDHMSIASQKGRPRMISGALKSHQNVVGSMQVISTKTHSADSFELLTYSIVTAGRWSKPLWTRDWQSRSRSPSPCTAASEGPPAWCSRASGLRGSTPGFSASSVPWPPAAGWAWCTWASGGWTCCASGSRTGSAPASQTQGTCGSCAGNTRRSGQSWTRQRSLCSACWGCSPAGGRRKDWWISLFRTQVSLITFVPCLTSLPGVWAWLSPQPVWRQKTTFTIKYTC